MSELMTWQEIEEAFDSEWVLIEDPDLTSAQEVIRGRVVFHGPDKEDLYSILEELRPSCSAIRFVGRLPDDFEMIL